jgi:general secretion pathway protein K
MSRAPRFCRQRGFALLTVLLVSALIAILASTMQYQHALDIERSANRLAQSQALVVGLGLDAWIKKGLAFDQQYNQTDHLGEVWAQPMLPVAFEGGQVGGQLLDLQARFNLNNLQEPNVQRRQRWQNLLEQMVLKQSPSPQSSAWIVPLIDWLDADNEALPGGAESEVYLLKTPPYRAANAPLVLAQEALLLEGMTPVLFRQLQPGLTTLPQVTPINVNTAVPMVLLGLAPWFDEPLVEAWLAQRASQPAQSVADFYQFVASQSGRDGSEIQTQIPDWMLAVKTDFFMLAGRVQFGRAEPLLYAVYHRTAERVTLLQRWIGWDDESR